MRKIGPEFTFDEKEVNASLIRLSSEITSQTQDSADTRKRLGKAGFSIETAEPKPPDEAGFIAADSSFSKKELRFNVLWGVHAVCVYGVYDGRTHSDSLIGQGMVNYRDLTYESRNEFGALKPYSNVDARIDALRVGMEASLLGETAELISREGLRVDYLLFDGSLTTLDVPGENPEAKNARARLSKLKSMNVVGLVEDSHDTDLSKQIGLEYPNTLVLDAALKPFEYVVWGKGDISVCYIKLPGKRLPHLGGAESQPFVARWEFKSGYVNKQLPEVLGVWMTEDDLHHPQTYPIRLADYLTRRMNVAGMLERFAAENGLLPQFRSSREA